MKSLISLMFVMYCATFVVGIPDTEKIQKMMKIIADCQMSSGASLDDVKMMMAKQMPETHNAKCMFNCILGGINILKNGEINKEKFVSWVTMQKGSSEKIAETVYNECNDIKDADPCELGTKIGFCFRTVCTKHGVDLDF